MSDAATRKCLCDIQQRLHILENKDMLLDPCSLETTEDEFGNEQLGVLPSLAGGPAELLRQQLLAEDGQVGKTTLAVAYAFDQNTEGPTLETKAQITSLGDGNVVFVYATGDDFTNLVVQEGPIFLSLGEVYVIQNVTSGTIITATEGAYGYSQQRIGNDESPMPLMSLALSFTDSFFFAFRSSQNYAPETDTGSQGFVHIVNTTSCCTCRLEDGSGNIIQGQEVTLQPWEYHRFYTDGNQEYRLISDCPIMAAVNAEMGTLTPRFFDSRLILPLSNDIMNNARLGELSALYAGTTARYYVNDGAAWNVGAGAILSPAPGAPVNLQNNQPAGTGASDQDYEAAGVTRILAAGLVSAFSGADSSGLEATPFCPTKFFSYRIALPLYIENQGDGGDNSITVSSIYEGSARIYEWDQVSGAAVPYAFRDANTGATITELPIIRRSGAVTTPEDQLYPASGQVSAQGFGGSDPNANDMLTDFRGGYIESNVPIMVIFNSQQNENQGTDHTFRGTTGPNVIGINSDDDEQLSFGISPAECVAEVTKGDDGLLYRRSIGAGGVDSWSLA